VSAKDGRLLDPEGIAVARDVQSLENPAVGCDRGECAVAWQTTRNRDDWAQYQIFATRVALGSGAVASEDGVLVASGAPLSSVAIGDDEIRVFLEGRGETACAWQEVDRASLEAREARAQTGVPPGCERSWEFEACVAQFFCAGGAAGDAVAVINSCDTRVLVGRAGGEGALSGTCYHLPTEDTDRRRSGFGIAVDAGVAYVVSRRPATVSVTRVSIETGDVLGHASWKSLFDGEPEGSDTDARRGTAIAVGSDGRGLVVYEVQDSSTGNPARLEAVVVGEP
jgi:hypothetical protein